MSQGKDMLQLLTSIGQWTAPPIAAICIVIYSQYRTLLKSTKSYKKRKREDYPCVEAWLLSDAQKKTIDLSLKDKYIIEMESAAIVTRWDYRKPPKLRLDSKSHFWNFLGTPLTSFLFPDIVNQIPETEIKAPIQAVWDELLNFENHGNWNPFHFKIDVVERKNAQQENRIYLELNVNLRGLIGKLCSYEEVHYVDSTKFVLIYGVSKEVPLSLRVIWLEERVVDQKEPSSSQNLDEKRNTITVLHSYDLIGGYPALLCKFYIEKLSYDGFCRQHLGLKQYMEKKQEQEQNPCH